MKYQTYFVSFDVLPSLFISPSTIKMIKAKNKKDLKVQTYRCSFPYFALSIICASLLSRSLSVNLLER